MDYLALSTALIEPVDQFFAVYIPVGHDTKYLVFATA
jgi:hypothetical protein